MSGPADKLRANVAQILLQGAGDPLQSRADAAIAIVLEAAAGVAEREAKIIRADAKTCELRGLYLQAGEKRQRARIAKRIATVIRNLGRTA